MVAEMIWVLMAVLVEIGENMDRIKTTFEVQNYREEKIIQSDIWHPKYNEWREVLEDYLTISRRRLNNKLSMLKLQMSLYHDLFSSQKVKQICNRIIKDPQKIKDYIDEENFHVFDLKTIKYQLEEENVVCKALSEIADGHLWRIFNFNRPLIYVMGSRPSSGYLNFDTGFMTEVYTWLTSINNPNVAKFLINDLTNYARLGDITIQYKDGSIELKEIKAGKSHRGKDRQKRRNGNFRGLFC